MHGTWVRSMVVEGVQQRMVWTERRRMVDDATTSTEQQKKEGK